MSNILRNESAGIHSPVVSVHVADDYTVYVDSLGQVHVRGRGDELDVHDATEDGQKLLRTLVATDGISDAVSEEANSYVEDEKGWDRVLPFHVSRGIHERLIDIDLDTFSDKVTVFETVSGTDYAFTPKENSLVRAGSTEDAMTVTSVYRLTTGEPALFEVTIAGYPTILVTGEVSRIF